jgi:ribosomal protein S4
MVLVSLFLHITCVITVREGSKSSPLFARLNSDNEDNEKRQPPDWVGFDASTLRAEVLAQPRYNKTEGGLDYATVFEFYSR